MGRNKVIIVDSVRLHDRSLIQKVIVIEATEVSIVYKCNNVPCRDLELPLGT